VPPGPREVLRPGGSQPSGWLGSKKWRAPFRPSHKTWTDAASLSGQAD
jgi:hypothetical protein